MRLKAEITRVHRANLGVYSTERVWRQLNREGIAVGRDRVARFMREFGCRHCLRQNPR